MSAQKAAPRINSVGTKTGRTTAYTGPKPPPASKAKAERWTTELMALFNKLQFMNRLEQKAIRQLVYRIVAEDTDPSLRVDSPLPAELHRGGVTPLTPVFNEVGALVSRLLSLPPMTAAQFAEAFKAK